LYTTRVLLNAVAQVELRSTATQFITITADLLAEFIGA
jgi:hypothetical protein